jgi:hypothetical protein
MGMGGQRHAPAILSPEITRYALYRSLDAPQGRFGRVQKVSPLPGFDLRTVQSIASRYTDYAILTNSLLIHSFPFYELN